jgi:predicted type IV restriction endonuclease
MDFKDQIRQLAERINKHKELVQTEEATKHTFIMPFIQALGYDVFNPLEVVPEYVADIGIKKGEKVDYAIVKDGAPIILIECKHWSANLNPHNSQLFRYFHTSKAKFGILTNGIESRFYTDLVEPNKMDEKAFFVFDIRDVRDNHIDELKKFHKSYFDHDTIVSTASELKYTGELKALLHQELTNPTPEIVRFFAKQVYPGLISQKVLDQFTQLTRRSFQQYLTDQITERLKSALSKEDELVAVAEPSVGVDAVSEDAKNGVITTEEELEAFRIIRAILRQKLEVSRVVHRDAQTYFAVLLDDNNRKPICRLYFGAKRKAIGLFNNDKREEVKVELQSVDDVYKHDKALMETVGFYLK